MYGCHLALVSGSIVLFDEASGAACLPRGVWPCGLSAAAPQFCVHRPCWFCGCFPLFSGETVVPLLSGAPLHQVPTRIGY